MILPADHVSLCAVNQCLDFRFLLRFAAPSARRSLTVDQVCTFPHPSFQMAKSVAKYSIMTQEMVDSFSEAFYIPVGVHPTAPGRDKTIIQFPADMGLLDFIQTADPRKVRAVEVQKGADQVMLLESTKDCFMPLVIPAAGGSSSAAVLGGSVRSPEERFKKRDWEEERVVPAKKLRTDHPSLASGTGGKTLASLEQIMPEGSHLLAREQPVAPSVVHPSQKGEGFVDLSAQWSFQILATAERLELPQELSRVHHTFHVSNLKKCYADEPLVMPLEGIHVDDKLQFVEEPVEIMEREIKRLKRSRIPLVKVRWNSRRGPEFTWEREDSFKQKYPQLFTNRASSSTTRS
ncbi:hypothetical protein Tco_1375722 [Tanacetum coccineum]